MAIQKILLPTDLSVEGERAFTGAVELARQLGARLQVLHVVENYALAPTQSARFPAGIPGTAEELALVRADLEQRRKAFPAGIETAVEALAAPNVPQAIMDYAAKEGCDLIALSSHGRTGFRRLILGSVAEEIVRRSRVPVLLFPRQE